jgi:hypothetical protein
MFGEGDEEDIMSVLFGETSKEEVQLEKPNLKRKIEELTQFQTPTKFIKIDLNSFVQEEKELNEKENTENEDSSIFENFFGDNLPQIEEREDEEIPHEEEKENFQDSKVSDFKIKTLRKETQRINDEKNDFRKILKFLEEPKKETTLTVQTKIYSEEKNETIEELKEDLMKEMLKMKEMDDNKMESIFNSIDSVISLLKYSKGSKVYF